MSHWNLQVTIESKDKEIMSRVAMPGAKWHFVNCKTSRWQKLFINSGKGRQLWETTADNDIYAGPAGTGLGVQQLCQMGAQIFLSPQHDKSER